MIKFFFSVLKGKLSIPTPIRFGVRGGNQRVWEQFYSVRKSARQHSTSTSRRRLRFSRRSSPQPFSSSRYIAREHEGAVHAVHGDQRR